MKPSDLRWKVASEPPSNFDGVKYYYALDAAYSELPEAMQGAHREGGWEKAQRNLPHLVKAFGELGVALQALGLDAQGVERAQAEVRKLMRAG